MVIADLPIMDSWKLNEFQKKVKRFTTLNQHDRSRALHVLELQVKSGPAATEYVSNFTFFLTAFEIPFRPLNFKK